MDVAPFHVQVAEETLRDLRERLIEGDGKHE
jgi:hypothetical protein